MGLLPPNGGSQREALGPEERLDLVHGLPRAEVDRRRADDGEHLGDQLAQPEGILIAVPEAVRPQVPLRLRMPSRWDRNDGGSGGERLHHRPLPRQCDHEVRRGDVVLQVRHEPLVEDVGIRGGLEFRPAHDDHLSVLRHQVPPGSDRFFDEEAADGGPTGCDEDRLLEEDEVVPQGFSIP